MCGIFGILSHDAPVDECLLERGTNSLAHRGPDDSGTILFRDVNDPRITIGLGNRRLAILDLSPHAHQPMHDPETGNWIVYNGEIYNFKSIRAELEKSGTIFGSHSDTEVVLKAYARWGEACFTKFRGMFAFALWDARKQSLLIVRDPMGIKPLYYADTGEFFLFSSEVRSLLGTGLIPKRIDPAGLLNFLTYGSAYDPLTMVQGISSLPAGHKLTWKSGKVSVSQYWDLLPQDEGQDGPNLSASDEKQTVADLRQMLEEAVRLQLVSDVPVGVFLSGGIDSSTLVSILAHAGMRPSTFSIVFREAEFSEAQHSRRIAKLFGTDHHEIEVSQQAVLDSIPNALRAMDLPTMDGVNTFFVSREARRAGVKVALSGLGGDEIFAGYSNFRSVPRAEAFLHWWKRVPYTLRRSSGAAFSFFANENDQSRKVDALIRANGELLHPYFLARMLFTPEQQAAIFPRDAAITERATASQAETLLRSTGLDPINRVSYLESRCYMLNTLLRDADSMSMSQGLEVRVPLIDHQLAKAVLRLPGAWKLNGAPKKMLLGALPEPLPDDIVHRPKRGFTLPFEKWMRQELRSEVESSLQENVASSGLGELIDSKHVSQIWNDFTQGTVSWTRPWALYVLRRWCEMHL